MSDDNVTRIYGDDEDDDDIQDAEVEDVVGLSDSTDLVEWVPPQQTVSLAEARIIASKAQMKVWVDDCRGALEYRGKAAIFYGIRLPLYAGRYSTFAGRGIARVTSRVWRWTHDTEGLEIRVRAATDPNLDAASAQRAHAAAHESRVKRVRWRRVFAGTITAFLLLVARWGVHAHLWWSVLVGMAIAVAFGMIGSQKGEVIQYLEVPAEYALTVDLVEQAFITAKIPKITPETPAIVVSPPYDQGRGYVVQVQIPPGATFSSVLTAQESLASGLNCPEDSLELDPMKKQSARLLELFVAKVHPLEADIEPWPLLAVDRWDVWRPVPVGWDIRGRQVTVALMWIHTLVGAAPQRGKSTFMRLLAIAALLDPRVDLIVVDFKGGIDWEPYRPWCRKFITDPDTELAVQQFSDLIDWLEGERVRRMTAIKAMDPRLVPNGRITPAMAETAAFRPIVVIVDEMQEATQSEDGTELVTRWAKLEKKCPAAGITITKATQKPDAKSAPTELRDVSLQRVSLSVPSRHASEAVLGTEAYQQGLNAAALGGEPGLGIVWAMDSEDGPGFRGKLRIPNCTPQMAAMMLERVARIRRPITVTAEAQDLPDDDPAFEVPQIVTDVLRVWPKGDVVAHAHDLAEALGLTRAEVTGPLRALGLPPNPQMKIRGRNRAGYDLIDVQNLTRSDGM